MKHFFTLFMMVLFLANAIGQNVGINNPTPQTALDIIGRLRLHPIGVEVTSAYPSFPANQGYVSYYGTPGVDFSIFSPTGHKGSFLVIENTTPNVLTISGLTDVPSGKLVLLFYSDLGWIVINEISKEWSMNGNAGTNPSTNFLGTIDNQALSIKTNDIDRIRISNEGKVGIGNSDPNLSLDITGGFGIRSVIGIPYLNNYNIPINVSFIELQQDGNVTGPVTIAGPDPWIDGRRVVIRNICGYPATFGTTVINSLETKEFICRNIGGWSAISENDPSQLEKIIEGSNTGWRLLGRDPNDYGDIGNHAVDFSVSALTSTILGATGDVSFAAGFETTASGHFSTAFGIDSDATGEASLAANRSWAAGLRSAAFNEAQAHGKNSFATGNGYVGDTGTNAAGISGGGAFGVNTAALGEGTHAVAFSSTAVGRYNEGGFNTSNRTSWVDTDPLFMIGNGTADNARSNALLVQKNGKMSIGPAAPAPSSILDIQSTTAGFLPPRMTLAQRNAIAAPAEGLMISCTDCSTKGLHQYINGAWQAMTSSNTGNYGTVVNPVTGKIWLDRNLGASQVATSPTDAASYGDLYQWGRNADGHQIRTSGITATLASNFFTHNGLFITTNTSPNNWLSSVETHMWSGTAAENNPCPSGFRIPTAAEWEQERLTWSSNNATGAFTSPLKLPMGGYRNFFDGSLYNVDTNGRYWSSTVSFTNAGFLYFVSTSAYWSSNIRADGNSVRCIKD
ncbi:MAG: FISUMP domain-containing protein [Saprospiraceae bacterium]